MMSMQIVFERQILESLRIKNPDLLNAFVCLGLAAGADGVAVMTAPGPLAHIKHKRRAGMISALVAAGFLRRAPGGYLVHGVGSEGTDRGQTEDTESTAAREASHCNVSQDNSGWTAAQQAVDSKEASREDSMLVDVAEVARREQWEDLPPEEGGGETGDGQTEDRGSTAPREASHCNASQDNSEGTACQQWQSMRDIDALEILLDGVATSETVVQVEDIEPTVAREALHRNTFQDNSEWTEDRQAGDSEGLADAFIDISDLDEPQPTAPIMSLGLRRSAVSTAATPPDDEALEARAREMALADWDVTDARTFETCEGDFAQFWTYRKRHFLAQARQELGPAES